MARVISGTAVATNPGDAGDTSTQGAAKAGGVVLGGVAVALDANVGQAFIADCSRHTEGLLCDDEIKVKWQLSAEYWRGLANNTPLLQAVRAERDRRIANGDAAREAAQRHLAKAPDVLGGILTNEQVSPRHRIEAAKELRQTAGNHPDTRSGPTEKFTIHIDLGGDEKLVYETEIASRRLLLADDDGEPS